MEGNPFSTAGNWYRGNTHSHTTTSDGKLSVAELTRDYEEREYDFLVITDHNVVADVSQSRAVTLLVIPGAEIAVCYDGTFAMEVCTLEWSLFGQNDGAGRDCGNRGLQRLLSGLGTTRFRPDALGRPALGGPAGLCRSNAWLRRHGRRGLSRDYINTAASVR